MKNISASYTRVLRPSDRRKCWWTQSIRKVNIFMFYFLCLGVCVGLIAKSYPEFLALTAERERLTEIQQREVAVNREVEQQLREYRALEQDPYFLEIYGRDRLDLYKKGERVFRFSRDKKL